MLSGSYTLFPGLLINLLFIDPYESHQNNVSNCVALYSSISFYFYLYRFVSVVLYALYFEKSGLVLILIAEQTWLLFSNQLFSN